MLSAVFGLALGGCADGGGTGGSSASEKATSSPSSLTTAMGAVIRKLTISGTPSTSVQSGAAYSFQPTAIDPGEATLTFSITDKPAWATFDVTTGMLSGTPTAANVGAYPGVTIAVSNGTMKAELAAFSIAVTAAPSPAAAQTTTTPSTVGSTVTVSTTPAATSTGTAGTAAVATSTVTVAATTTVAATAATAPTSTAKTAATTAAMAVTSTATLTSTSTSAAGTASPSATVLKIAGSPSTATTVGTSYSFAPTVTAPSGDKVTLSIANKPAWATFDAATGTLSGTPGAANVGVSTQITISASDGTTTAQLAFSISVTSSSGSTVTVSWTAPTLNSDGTPVTDVAGYRVYYGLSASNFTMIEIDSPAALQQAIGNLSSGTWFFAVASLNGTKVESTLSTLATISL